MTMRDLIPWGRNRTLPAARDTQQANLFGALHREMNRLFDDFFDRFNWRLHMPSVWSFGWPQVEVSDGENEVNIVAELPGLEEKDVELTLQDGMLTIRGEKRAESNGATYSERWHAAIVCFFCPPMRAHARTREGHDGSAVCGGGPPATSNSTSCGLRLARLRYSFK